MIRFLRGQTGFAFVGNGEVCVHIEIVHPGELAGRVQSLKRGLCLSFRRIEAEGAGLLSNGHMGKELDSAFSPTEGFHGPEEGLLQGGRCHGSESPAQAHADQT